MAKFWLDQNQTSTIDWSREHEHAVAVTNAVSAAEVTLSLAPKYEAWILDTGALSSFDEQKEVLEWIHHAYAKVRPAFTSSSE